jgi:hypothetical protein
MLVVAMVALLAGGCDLVPTPTVSGGPGCRKLIRQDAADYVNFVKLNGITYTADRPAVGRMLGEGDLGPVHATVRCSLREKMDPTRSDPLDGDAAYLDAGSPLYRVRGYRPIFRLAARQDGRLVLFEADAYGGRYSFHGDRVIHHVELSLFPNWVGTDQQRWVELAGDRLTLSASPLLLAGTQQVPRLVWERVDPWPDTG